MITFVIVAALAVFFCAFLFFTDKPPAEFLVLLAIGGIALCILLYLFGGFSALVKDERPQAEQAARNWATALGYTDVKAVCTDKDTDMDGYVSCTVAGMRAGVQEVLPVECARSTFTLNDGCRIQRPIGARGLRLRRRVQQQRVSRVRHPFSFQENAHVHHNHAAACRRHPPGRNHQQDQEQ